MSSSLRPLVFVAACFAAAASAGTAAWRVDGETSTTVVVAGDVPVERTFAVVVPPVLATPLVTARVIATAHFPPGANAGDAVRFIVSHAGRVVRDQSTLGSNPREVDTAVSMTCGDGGCDRTVTLEITRTATSTSGTGDVTVDVQVIATAIGGGERPEGATIEVAPVAPLP